MAPEFARPTARHTLTASAIAAVESVRRAAHAQRVADATAVLVTDVGRRPSSFDRDPVTANARALQALAAEAGFEVVLRSGAAWCRVEGVHAARVGFSALWREGGFDSATWHEPWRYAMVTDERTVAVDARARVGKANHRSPGVGRRHLAIEATPWGKPLGWGALRARVVGYHP